ncbi:MAG: tetratricopeptide repeat protein [Chloroflexi bacterium]|nr:tetratricopeptide repeat protein [Chloroflexota bacterium]
MSMDYLARLAAAQSAEERTWIITESLVNSLPDDVRSAVWAAAIPHWFDEKILAALRPELAQDAARLYVELQAFPFVEIFQGRGHNTHELTRKLMLVHLWNENQEEFRALSQRAAEYFLHAEDIICRIEGAYNLLVADETKSPSIMSSFGWELNNNFQFSELDALVNDALEHINAGRLAGNARGWAFFFKARLERQAYRMDTALALLERARADASDDNLKGYVVEETGDVLQFLDKRDEALARYAEALGLFRAVGSRLGEANTLQAIGDVQRFRADNDAALKSYEQALGLFRDVGDRGLFRDVGARLGEANTLVAQGQLLLVDDPKRADALLEQAIELFHQIGDRYSVPAQIGNYGWALLRLNQAERAQSYFSRAAELFEQVGMANFAEQCRTMVSRIETGKILTTADAMYKEKNFEQAAAEFRRAIESEPSARAWNGLGSTLESLERYDEAIDAYTHAITLEPDSAYLYRNRAGIEYQRKNYERAVMDFRRATELASDDSYAWNGLGNTLESLERYDEAIDAYSHAIALDSDSAYLYRNRANDLLELNRLEEAEQDIARAMELEPEHPYTHARQGYLALARGEFADAVLHFEFAASKEDKAEWKLGVGLAKFGAGDVDSAKAIIADASTKADADDKKSFQKWLERLVKSRPELADAARGLLL